MSTEKNRGTLLGIPLIREKYTSSFLASLAIHSVMILLFLFGGYLLPQTTIRIGSGAGGGMGGDVQNTVGVVDELSGGAGMVKPSLVPKPPALKEKPEPKDDSKAIPLANTLDARKKRPDSKDSAKKTKEVPLSNMIPTAPEPGSGGAGGQSGGSGGGFGGGNGVSIGPGSGGFGDSYYARAVEKRIGENWTKNYPEGARFEIVYSFFIKSDGSIAGVKLEKSSGNPLFDMYAERSIKALTNLPRPPAEYRGRPIQFVAQFIYPPSQ
jgi:outer membrane biosynthesis protein TonB